MKSKNCPAFIPNLTTKSQLELSEKKLINAYKRCYLALQEKIFEFIKHHPEKKEEWLKKSKELGESYQAILTPKAGKV